MLVFPAVPPGLARAYPRVELAADMEQSAPDLWLPQSRQALLGEGRLWPDSPRETPAGLKAFVRAFGGLRGDIGNQIGGHALPVQDPVEYEIADAALGGTHAKRGDRLLDQEAGRWILLAQFSSTSDASMTWGEDGAQTLYWLIRREDLAARRFDQARLTVQC